MVKRLTVAGLLMIAVFSTAVHLPAQSCAMSMPVQTMPCGDCCAKMKSCVLPQKDLTPPATASSQQQVFALIAPTVQPVQLQALIASAIPNRRAPGAFCDSPPRLAVLCTFLI